MTTPAVVEKQLIDIELKSGHYETERPERSDWTKKLSVVKNLVVDEYGVLVKRRPALILGDYLDEDNASFAPNYRFVNYGDSVCHLGTKFQLYHYDESGTKFRKKQRHSEFSVTQNVVGSSNTDPSALYTPSTDFFNNITSVASSTSYAIACYSVSIGTGASPARMYVTLSDRNSGLRVRSYRFDSVSGAGLQGSVVVADDRYLHIFAHHASIGTVHNYVIDLNAPPSDAAIITLTSLAATGMGSYVHAAYARTGGAILVRYDAAGNTNVDLVDNTGAVTLNNTVAGSVVGSDVNSTHVWVCLSGTQTLVKFNITTLATTAFALTNFYAINPTYWMVSVDQSTGNARIIASHATITTGQAAAMGQIGVYSLASGATALVQMGYIHGWSVGSHPWYDSNSARHYVHLVKQRYGQNGSTVTRETVGAHIVADITEAAIVGAGGAYLSRFRPVAVLDNYAGQAYYNAATNSAFRVASTPTPRAALRSYSTILGLTQLATATTRSYVLAELSVYDVTAVGSADGLISGGVLSSYDGTEIAELGFVDSPSVWHTQVAGGLAAGTRNYVAVFEYADDDGNVHYSRVSPVSSATNTGAQLNRVEVNSPAISAHHGNSPYGSLNTSRVGGKLYRTTSGGTVYYLVTTWHGETGSSGTFGTYDDSLSDATLITRPQLFRQPGIANAALDRFHAPASTCIVRHKDRVFIARGSTLYYSSFAVDGEAPWFNPAFSVPVPGGTGGITALASADGILVVFKRDGIWLLEGDGPPENGGNGSEFSTPRRISTEYGCIDQRSVVMTPDGLMYASLRGIELLTRSFSVADPWVGEAVKDTLASYDVIGGACFDRGSGRVLFVVGKSSGAYRGTVAPSDQGRVLAYDTAAKAWSVFLHHSGTGVYGYALQDVAYAKLYQSGEPSDQVVYLDPSYYVLREDATYGMELDGASYFIPFSLETAWIRGTSMQDRIRVSDFLFLAKKLTNHNLKISVAYDYSDTYSYTKTWTPADYSTVEQLELQIPRQAVQAVRFKIEDEAPADTVTYSLGTGKGCEILCLTAKLGLRGGGAKLSSGQKG